MRNREIDIENPAELLAYLQAGRWIASGEVPLIRVLAGGVSNRTVLVKRANGESWVLKQALGKLRVPVDWFSEPGRIQREALGLKWLAELAPPGTITPLVFEDFEQHLLAMQAVPEPHQNWKTRLLAGHVELDHVRQFGQLLGTIHGRASERQAELASLFEDRSFFESLRIEPYYRYSAQQVPEAGAFIGRLIEDTYGCRETLVHGDYSPKNILIHQDKLILLDHEVIHYGDGAFDIGFSLTHLLSKARHLTARRADFAAAARLYWEAYNEALADGGCDRAFEARSVRHTLACLFARVTGRSQLEYLEPAERTSQRQVALSLMKTPPQGILALIDQFLEG